MYTDNAIIYQNDYLLLSETADTIIIDLKTAYLSSLFYTKAQSDALYLSSSLLNSFQSRLTNASNSTISLLNQSTNKIKTLSLNGGSTLYGTSINNSSK